MCGPRHTSVTSAHIHRNNPPRAVPEDPLWQGLLPSGASLSWPAESQPSFTVWPLESHASTQFYDDEFAPASDGDTVV